MPASRFRRVFFCSALVVLLVAVGLFAAACGETAEETTTTAAPAETTTTAAPAETTTTVAAETTTTAAAPKEFIFGMLLVGPYNDNGWSQAHYEAGLYVEEKLPGAKMVYVDKVNPADRPGTTPEQLAEDLVAQGAKMIFFNSDDMKDGAVAFAQAHPDIPVIHASGDGAWKEGKDFKNLPNLSNVMGKMEYGKMIAGVAAALTTKTGKIGYLGPLINDETRRLAASVYLGAKYAWTEYLGKDPADLKFTVNWIGFWFNIPGVTSDPTQVADNFFNQGYDVVISGIDTTEALVQAGKADRRRQEGLGHPLRLHRRASIKPRPSLSVSPTSTGGRPTSRPSPRPATASGPASGTGIAPDWADINNPDTSAVGFKKGEGLSADAAAKVDEFITALAGGLNLWKGPLNLQDGTAFLAEGAEAATDQQIWYLPQLLEGMEGQSVAE